MVCDRKRLLDVRSQGVRFEGVESRGTRRVLTGSAAGVALSCHWMHLGEIGMLYCSGSYRGYRGRQGLKFVIPYFPE